MGTRADFYVGRGLNAEWLGSIAMDGYPDGHVADPKYGPLISTDTEDVYRARVAELIAGVGHGTTPDLGWPWPWKNSRLTDFSYAFDGAIVWVSNYGRPWHKPGDKPPEVAESDAEPCADPARMEFPDMEARQKVTFGPRSGLLVLGLPVGD